MRTYIVSYLSTHTKNTYIQTFKNTNMQTYKHANMHTCVHAHMHTCGQTYRQTCIRTYVHTYLRTYVHTYVRLYIQILKDIQTETTHQIDPSLFWFRSAKQLSTQGPQRLGAQRGGHRSAPEERHPPKTTGGATPRAGSGWAVKILNLD